jgi:DNA polymerase IIIc chi subunit
LIRRIFRRAHHSAHGGRGGTYASPHRDASAAFAYPTDRERDLTDVLFYHLQAQPVERVLPVLLEKSLERGWRVVVHTTVEERVDALDAHLWTFREDSFLPHGTFREPTAAEQPVLLTVKDDNPNGATVRFLLDRAPMPEDAGRYDRLVLMFDGNDDDAVAEARQRWQAAKALGFALTYWQADESGRWQRKA